MKVRATSDYVNVLKPKAYYVIYKVLEYSADGKTEITTPIMISEDEEICKDFCKKHLSCKYYEEVVENE